MHYRTDSSAGGVGGGVGARGGAFLFPRSAAVDAETSKMISSHGLDAGGRARDITSPVICQQCGIGDGQGVGGGGRSFSAGAGGPRLASVAAPAAPPMEEVIKMCAYVG